MSHMIKTVITAFVFLLTGLATAQADGHGSTLSDKLNNPTRADGDKARDAGRKPADVIAFAGFGEGMKVIDLVAAGGYYTEVLSYAVGESGTVYSQNPPYVLKFRDGANDKALTARLADDRLANVVRLDKAIGETGIEAGTLDGALTALNFHDVYNRDPQTAVDWLNTVGGLLKSDGVLIIIDHDGKEGADNKSLHRIHKAAVIETAKKAGLAYAGESDLLANPDDDHSQMVFAPDIRGKTDRFLLKFRIAE